jgi:hypothetical protein
MNIHTHTDSNYSNLCELITEVAGSSQQLVGENHPTTEILLQSADTDVAGQMHGNVLSTDGEFGVANGYFFVQK